MGESGAPLRRCERRAGSGDLIDEPQRAYHDRDWLRAHLEEERHGAELLGEIREAIFGAQDGVTSILAVVSTVAIATSDRYAVLVAGIAAALAEVFSMAAGEYMSSKSQQEIFEAQIEKERQEVAQRPAESEAEVAYLLEEEGLPADAARHVAAELAREPAVLLKTMVEKELGISTEPGASPLQGALILAAAFAGAALVPLAPYFFLPVQPAIVASIGVSAVVMFALGVLKARWTLRNPLRSGLEILLLVAGAAVASVLFGNVLPAALGAAGFHP